MDKKTNLLFISLVLCIAFVSCKSDQQSNKETTSPPEEEQKTLTIAKTAFGECADGPVSLYTLTNGNGMTVKITNYGGIVTSIIVPDKSGKMGEVTLGFDNLEGYLGDHPYFGSIIGRYGNRIGKGTFSIDGKKYELATNNGSNHLHGGVKGFDKVLWEAKPLESSKEVGVQLNYISPDGEEGYPGQLSVKMTYTLNNNNELKMNYQAKTNQTTHCNLTNHTYFNLAGPGAETILNHELTLVSDFFTPVDETLIPTGELRQVSGTPFDFRKARKIGDALAVEGNKQLEIGGGIDHNFVLTKTTEDLELAAILYEAGSGRVVEVLTTEPGVQFYTGNFLNGTVTGREGVAYPHRSGLCLETQHYPDSPNKPKFPTTLLSPEEKYETTTVYKFSVR